MKVIMTYRRIIRWIATQLGGLLYYLFTSMVFRMAVILNAKWLFSHTVFSRVVWHALMPTAQRLALMGKNEFE